MAQAQGSAPPPLRLIRIARGLTLTELANRLNMDPAQLHRIESGKHDVRVGTLYRVAHALGAGELTDQLRPYVRERAS